MHASSHLIVVTEKSIVIIFILKSTLLRLGINNMIPMSYIVYILYKY